jgi:hypothetical protein
MLEIEERDGTLSLDLYPIRTDEQFERVIEIVQEEFGAHLLTSSAFPGYREAALELDGVVLTFKHSSLEGNRLESTDPRARSTIERVSNHFDSLLNSRP